MAGILSSGITHAQEVEEPIPSVEILGNPDKKALSFFLKGLDTFEKKKALAPHAEARFLVVNKNKSDQTDVTLEYRGSDGSASVLVSGGIFVLPQRDVATPNNKEIVSNRKAGSLRWGPSVQTPGLPPNERRIGDLRMECEMKWAMEYDDISFITRNIFRMAGGPCSSSKISVSFFSLKKIRSATILFGQEKKNIVVGKDGYEYFSPIYDGDISNEAVITFEYDAD